MKTSDRLSLVADALLATLDRDPRCPAYSEEAWERKERLAQRREPQIRMPPSEQAFDWLFLREWADILRSARLTKGQTEVFLLRAAGHTFESIGARRGHTKQGSLNIFLQAVKKIRRARNVYRYAGLSQVYRDEVKRGAFGPPRR